MAERNLLCYLFLCLYFFLVLYSSSSASASSALCSSTECPCQCIFIFSRRSPVLSHVIVTKDLKSRASGHQEYDAGCDGVADAAGAERVGAICLGAEPTPAKGCLVQ